MNWVLPRKFIAFAGPHEEHKWDNGYPLLAPENYFDYFRRGGVTDIVRLNNVLYDKKRFEDAGFKHHGTRCIVAPPGDHMGHMAALVAVLQCPPSSPRHFQPALVFPPPSSRRPFLRRWIYPTCCDPGAVPRDCREWLPVPLHLKR